METKKCGRKTCNRNAAPIHGGKQKRSPYCCVHCARHATHTVWCDRRQEKESK